MFPAIKIAHFIGNKSITDIARQKNAADPNGVIANWMRNRNTVEFLGIWETLHNPNFNPLEFEGFRKEAGLNAFTLSPTRWIEATNAIGIVSQAGRYGGTFVPRLQNHASSCIQAVTLLCMRRLKAALKVL